ncbi:hypothetical protein M422DRAFT_255242 [Sphaerobolus stellatus SS14]|uniref:Uncharacterized protein n=1 Tax=Sphaerobolus stellatus (strain SS14) TaxID=990650 RepID=A0A0C9V3X3_SPHS4|nr:hypothetical protein M422DRAFT_255242 [Sphaerobolus stellatus SS14]
MLPDDFTNLQAISCESETTALALLASRYFLLCIIDTMMHLFTGNPYKAYETVLDQLVDEHPYDILMPFTKMITLNAIVSVLEIAVDRGSAGSIMMWNKIHKLHNILPIEDSFLRYLNPVQTYQFSLINKAAYRAAQEYRSYVYDINRLLRHFFSDPIAFRTLQAQTGTIISGSMAVQFFSGTIWTNSDLDLYVPPDSVTTVSKWMEAQSYVILPQRPTKGAADNTNIDPEGDPSLEYKHK